MNFTEFAKSINGKPWQKAGHNRIYFGGYGKDISAYLDYVDFDGEVMGDFDESQIADPLMGSVLKVFSNCNQSRNWILNRCKQVKHKIMLALNEILGDEIAPVCENWQAVCLSCNND